MAPARMRRLDRLILDAVQRLGPTSVWPISQYVVQRRWCLLGMVSTGSMYVALARLEKLGWVASKWDDGPLTVGGHRRRLYFATPDGMAQR